MDFEENLGFWAFSRDIVIPSLWQGIGLTVELLLISGTLGILLGFLVAFARISRRPWLRWIAQIYIQLIRGTPLLLQILFVYFALPSLINITMDAFPAGVLALTLNAAGYLAEIFRAGIESIDKGQWEAARSLGMSHSLTMRRIILPQTFRRIIPPTMNEMAALAKDTSLVSAVALGEMLFVAQRLGAKYLRPWEVYLWAGAGYLMIVLGLSWVARTFERRLALKGDT